MLFIDANVLIAYYNKEDIHHLRALVLWKEIEQGHHGDFFTSDYVFNEAVGVTNRKLGKEHALQLGNHILKSLVLLNINDLMLTEAWTIFQKTSLRLNLVDCTNLVALKTVSTTLIATFDEEFKNVPNIKVIS